MAGELKPGERVVARVDRRARHATAANHTATHLLHAALRARLGSHVRQAGSYVGPDKLRFDFTHGARLSDEDLRAVEDQVNAWITGNDPVRPIATTLDEAKALGATALFGEKYGDIVRMVEIGDGSWSRELCGGTHVRSTAEIGLLKITSEGVERGERAPHRGDHRSGGGRARPHARRAAARGGARAAHAARRVPEADRARSSSAPSRRRRRRPAAASTSPTSRARPGARRRARRHRDASTSPT